MCEILTYRQFRKYLHKDCLVFSGLDDQDHKKIPRLEEMTIKLCKNYTSELFKSLAFVKLKDALFHTYIATLGHWTYHLARLQIGVCC